MFLSSIFVGWFPHSADTVALWNKRHEQRPQMGMASVAVKYQGIQVGYQNWLPHIETQWNWVSELCTRFPILTHHSISQLIWSHQARFLNLRLKNVNYHMVEKLLVAPWLPLWIGNMNIPRSESVPPLTTEEWILQLATQLFGDEFCPCENSEVLAVAMKARCGFNMSWGYLVSGWRLTYPSEKY
jgi:hypothetical protein